jgi:hypothetical protein
VRTPIKYEQNKEVVYFQNPKTSGQNIHLKKETRFSKNPLPQQFPDFRNYAFPILPEVTRRPTIAPKFVRATKLCSKHRVLNIPVQNLHLR